MDVKELVEKVIGLVKNSDVTQFELRHEGTILKISRGSVQPVSVLPAPVARIEQAISVPQPNNTSQAASSLPPPLPDNLHKVESPLVGTFYRKPSPDSEPFVQEGASVKKGDTLCIVEAMKLMNEIEAPVSGKIEKILVGDGSVVEYGEVLFLINPAA